MIIYECGGEIKIHEPQQSKVNEKTNQRRVFKMKKVKSVAFNVSDPIEYALYNYALGHSYFSTYVKRLIQRDMEHGQGVNLEKYMKGFEEYNKPAEANNSDEDKK
ncbi:hypothetical protein HV453_18335 [Bacillus sporothermodurans]|nr:hypothetical protein [Heyndrickxia sporothermodurans]